jgi:serine protease AprX
VADLTAAQVAVVRSRGLLVTPDGPVQLDGMPSRSRVDTVRASSGARLSVRDLIGGSLLGTGTGKTIAVIDSGVAAVPALAGRVVQGADFTGTGTDDGYGHGTFVAALAAGNGADANGNRTGIVGAAPGARIVSVKIADDKGRSTVGQVMAGIAWTIDHRADYNISVDNLSLSAARSSSYLGDPLDALVEAAWFSGITVLASSGNEGTSVRSAPGNDPYVITVGSVGDQNTLTMRDDATSVFSNAGATPDGVAKPEVSTFGEHVQAALPAESALADMQVVSGLPSGYGQMSGTSMSTGVAAGVAVLLLAAHPSWTPGQVKSAFVSSRNGVSELRPWVAAVTRSPADANRNLAPSVALAVAYAQQILHTQDYANVVWSDVTWSDVTWSDVTWSDVVWSDVARAIATAATWSDATWSDATWSDAVWSDAVWSDATWSNAVWADAWHSGNR